LLHLGPSAASYNVLGAKQCFPAKLALSTRSFLTFNCSFRSLRHFDVDRPDDFRARTSQQLNQMPRSLFGSSSADADTPFGIGSSNAIFSIVAGLSLSPDLSSQTSS
jgi:hypothetical protein